MTFEEENIKRLGRGICQCEEVIGAKRRLGGDATDKELAEDKRIARRIKHRLEVALSDWGDGKHHERLDGSGAKLIWSEWWEQWRVDANALARLAKSNPQDHSIQREIEGMTHVFAEHRS